VRDKLKIGNKNVYEKTYIIAEIGNNHEGDFGLARALIYMAAAAGADAVKFQAITPRELISPNLTDRIAQLSKYSFTVDQFAELSDLAKMQKVHFLCTPFSISWIEPLSEFCDAIKIASGDNNFFDLIEGAASTLLPLIVSTGLADMDMVLKIADVVKKTRDWNQKPIELAFLHCVSAYPAPIESLNLKCINILKELGFPVGYSDHSIGNLGPISAVSLGACIIEKHFTISKNYSEFRDHQLSADYDDLRSLVRDIRLVESALGESVKSLTSVEVENSVNLRRSVSARHALSAGKLIEDSDLIMLRPGDGIAPEYKSKVLGRILQKEKKIGESIHFDDLLLD
jgi:N,N'-diacetyllegionaminate synthase